MAEHPILKQNGATTNAQEGRAAGTALQSWREWRRVCALDLSSDQTQDVLLKFVSHRFRNWVARYIANTNAGEVTNVGISARQAWHLFEAHVTVKQTRQGKAYKEWLFARGDASTTYDLDRVQGGASLILRDVVRTYLAAEFSPAKTLPLTMTIGTTGDTRLTFADLLPGEPDPSQALSQRELSHLADRHARSLFEEMTHRERIALLAKQAHISLSHPVVIQAAGCGKSALHEAYTQVARRLHARITLHQSDADAPGVLTLAGLCLSALVELMSTWSHKDRRCSGLRQQMHELAAL